MNARNVPSHPALLDWLSEDFGAHKYDARRLVRGIVLSSAYALGHCEAPADSFATSVERPLTGEQLARSWRVAAGLSPEDDTLRAAVVKAMPDVLPKEFNATFQQAQFLTNSPAVAALLKPEGGNSVERLAALPDNTQRAREAFAAVYGREPDADENAQVVAFLDARAGQLAEASRDLMWALITSAEFLSMP